MSSNALVAWAEDSSTKLDELLAAHSLIGGTGPGRRYATEQLNASIVVQIAAHFQLFCRNLHSETAQVIVLAAPAPFRAMLRVALTNRRNLDRGNASVANISADFARFDLDIWTAAADASARTVSRRQRLEQLNRWRNAIAHQDFTFSPEQRQLLADTSPTLSHARRWRIACDGLARTFNRVVAEHVREITGTRPW